MKSASVYESNSPGRKTGYRNSATSTFRKVLVDAAKLASRESPELAMIRARELERGNPNRATLARKMVCYMLAVERRQQNFVPAGECVPTAVA